MHPNTQHPALAIDDDQRVLVEKGVLGRPILRTAFRCYCLEPHARYCDPLGHYSVRSRALPLVDILDPNEKNGSVLHTVFHFLLYFHA
jgi:hypothetical protein